MKRLGKILILVIGALLTVGGFHIAYRAVALPAQRPVDEDAERGPRIDHDPVDFRPAVVFGGGGAAGLLGLVILAGAAFSLSRRSTS